MKNLFSMPAPLWILLTIAVLVIIWRALRITLRKTNWKTSQQNKIFGISIFAIISWIILLSVLSLNNYFSNFSAFPPRLLFTIIFPLPVIMTIAFSKKGSELLQLIPSHWLAFIQSFRILVEILLWMAFLKNMLPIQMTFEGGNLDILSGIIALPIGYMLLRQKKKSINWAIAFNIIGIILLLNILVIAVLSMPTHMRYFMNEPANTLVTKFPFIFLPGVLVPVAYSMHIFSLRKLLYKRKETLLRLRATTA